MPYIGLLPGFFGTKACQGSTRYRAQGAMEVDKTHDDTALFTIMCVVDNARAYVTGCSGSSGLMTW